MVSSSPVSLKLKRRGTVLRSGGGFGGRHEHVSVGREALDAAIVVLCSEDGGPVGTVSPEEVP